MRTKLFLFVSLVILTCACMPQKPFDWTRTTDQFNPKTGVYYNESIPMKLTVPDDWEVYAELETSKLSKEVSEAEKKGYEFAMFGQHPSGMVGASIVLQKRKSIEQVLSPAEFVSGVKELNKDELKNYKELVLIEKDLKGLRVADWKYEYIQSPIEIKATVRELLFLHNDYAVRIRCFSPSYIYHKFEHKCEEILESISVE